MNGLCRWTRSAVADAAVPVVVRTTAVAAAVNARSKGHRFYCWWREATMTSSRGSNADLIYYLSLHDDDDDPQRQVPDSRQQATKRA